MSIIAEFSIPAPQFVLGKALQEAPALDVELEQMVPAESGTIPYFWVWGADRDQFETVLTRDPKLTRVDVIDDLEDRTLYRVEWDLSFDTFIQTLGEHNVVLQRAGGDHESWTFQLRFPDSDTLSEFHTACTNEGVDVTVERLYNPAESTAMNPSTMTDAQRTLVEHAYDEGYFGVPRETTLAELAAQLEISDQAVNERLRRGLDGLIAATLKSDIAETE